LWDVHDGTLAQCLNFPTSAGPLLKLQLTTTKLTAATNFGYLLTWDLQTGAFDKKRMMLDNNPLQCYFTQITENRVAATNYYSFGLYDRSNWTHNPVLALDIDQAARFYYDDCYTVASAPLLEPGIVKFFDLRRVTAHKPQCVGSIRVHTDINTGLDKNLTSTQLQFDSDKLISICPAEAKVVHLASGFQFSSSCKSAQPTCMDYNGDMLLVGCKDASLRVMNFNSVATSKKAKRKIERQPIKERKSSICVPNKRRRDTKEITCDSSVVQMVF